MVGSTRLKEVQLVTLFMENTNKIFLSLSACLATRALPIHKSQFYKAKHTRQIVEPPTCK
jgi:hypothetical protein